MDVVAGQPIRGRDQNQVNFTQRGLLAQPLQTRPGQLGPAIAIISKNPFFGQFPALFSDVGLEPVELLINGLALLLA